MRFVKTLELGILLAAAATGLHAQSKPTSGKASSSTPAPASKPASPQAKPAVQTAAKPAATNASSQVKTAAPAAAPKAAQTPKPAQPKAAAPKTGDAGAARKSSPKTAKRAKPATAASGAPAAKEEPRVAKRDPFESLVGREAASAAAQKNLPAGKAGLQVSTLRLDGIVRAPNGMIAVVSNPQARTYFLHEGDQLYDGRVEKIGMDGVSFHEIGKDAFGKPVERQVNKRIYASAGEQQ